ncbi:uncharacterized protein LOC127708804 [Mytilus californianus]|uniref:uncharacterized protein LOC127708804 n=1 Tax=Mytilus californianus TaxID=6549 RepID=UPI002246B538|nr:uncharacterized protein LOC127708804 [Mytilus californianus]
MDFTDADLYNFPTCACDVIINGGNTLSFSQIYAPGYIQCGTSITIKDNTGDIRYIVNCSGQTMVNNLKKGDTIEVILKRHFNDADAKYCYRLDISGTKSPSIQVSCQKHTTSTTTTTTTVTTTENKLTTGSLEYNTSDNTTAYRHNQDMLNENCQQQTTVVVLASLFGVCLIYSVAITIYIIRRGKPKPVVDECIDRHRDGDDIYEEIRPSYIAPHNIPIYNPSTRPLPNPNTSQTKLRKTPLPSHMNNTYDRAEEKIGQTIYVNQRF